jgi:hypothetical protein
MPALANATDIAKGVVLARMRINRSRRSAKRFQPLGLAVPGGNAKTGGQQILRKQTLGK